MADTYDFDGLEDQVADLELAMGGASGMAAKFAAELSQMQATIADTGREVATLERGISSGLKRAIDGLVFDGDTLADALRGVGQSMLDAAYNAALKPVTSHVGGLLAQGVESLVNIGLPFAHGGAFAQGRVMPFARGGVVDGPTHFPMRGGTGLMGEAGPEAIMPLARGADGRLGVRAAGGSAPVQVVMNISTPDLGGFQRSQSQIAAQMARLIASGQRNG